MLEFNSRNFKLLTDQNGQLKEKLKQTEERQELTLRENARLIESNESHRIVIYQQQSTISGLEETINALKLELAALKGSSNVPVQGRPIVLNSSSTTAQAQISLGVKSNPSQSSNINGFDAVRCSTTSLAAADSSTSRYCSTMHILSRDDSLNDLSNSHSQTRVGSPKNSSSQPQILHKKSSSIFNSSTKTLAPLAFQNTLGQKRQHSTETTWISSIAHDESLHVSTQWAQTTTMLTGSTTPNGHENNSNNNEQIKSLTKIPNHSENSKKGINGLQSKATAQPTSTSKQHLRSGSCFVGGSSVINNNNNTTTSTAVSNSVVPTQNMTTATGTAGSTSGVPRLGSSASQSNYSSLTVLKSALFSQQQSQQPIQQSASQTQLLSVGQSRKPSQHQTYKKDQTDRQNGSRQGATTPTASLSIHQSSTSNLQNVNSTYASVTHSNMQKVMNNNNSNYNSNNKENGYFAMSNNNQAQTEDENETSMNLKNKSNSQSNRSTFMKATPNVVQGSQPVFPASFVGQPSPFIVKQTSTISPAPQVKQSEVILQSNSSNGQINEVGKVHQDEDALGMYRVSKKEPMLLKKPTSHSFFRQQNSNGSTASQSQSVSSSIDYSQYKLQRKQGGSQANISSSLATATTTIDLSRTSSLSQHVHKQGGSSPKASGQNGVNASEYGMKQGIGQTFGSINIKGKQLWGEDENYLTLNEEQPHVNCNYFSTKPGQLHSLLPPSSRQEDAPPLKKSTNNTATISIIPTTVVQMKSQLSQQQYSVPQYYTSEGGVGAAGAPQGIRCDTSGTCDISFVQPQVNQNLEFKVKSKSTANLNKEPGRLKQHLEGAAGFGKVRAESIYQKEPTVIADRIFESFYVFGVDRNQINRNTNVPQMLTPKVEMRFPQDQVYSENRENVLPLFAFPKGVETQRVRMSDSLSQMNEVMFANYVVENNPNCFTFVIKSDDSFKRAHETSNQANTLLAQCNPSRLLYGICFKINDLIEDVPMSENNQQKHNAQQNQPGFWVSKKALCFVTYYPFMKFFLDIISYFLNQLKMERISSDSINNPCQADTHLLMKVMASTGADLLRNLQQLATPSIGANIRLNHMSTTFEYNVPSELRAKYIEAEEHSSLVFQCVPCETFVRVFLSVLTEQPVVIVSQNQSVLSAAVLFIYSLLKPLKWPHPLITSLPNSLIHLLDSPVPIFVGLNMSKSDVIAKGLFARYEYCSFVFLDEQNKRVESYHSDFDHLARNSRLYAKFLDVLQPILLEIQMNKSASNSTIGLIGSQGISNLRKTTRTQSAIFQTGNSSRLESSKNLAGSTSTAISNDLGASGASRISNLQQASQQQQCSPVEREKELAGQFISAVSRLLKSELLDHLPLKNQLGPKKDILDFELIEQHIRNKIPKFDSDPLLSRVLRTQMFSYFLEEYYFE